MKARSSLVGPLKRKTIIWYFGILFTLYSCLVDLEGTISFASRFGTDDLIHRILLLMQMRGVGALAVNVPEAFGNTALGFALSYAFMCSVLVVEYFGTLR